MRDILSRQIPEYCNTAKHDEQLYTEFTEPTDGEPWLKTYRDLIEENQWGMETAPYTSKNKPIRVAIVHYRDDVIAGGSLRVGETIANNLDPKKIEAHLVFAYGEAGSITENARVPCHFVRAKGPKDFTAWKRARTFFRDLSPDLIHFQDAVVWLRGALLGESYKNILHLHGKLLPLWMKRRDQVLMRMFCRLSDAVVCINDGARDSLLTLRMSEPDKAYVVYNSVDYKKFSAKQDKQQARASLNLPDEPLLIGMVCRLVWQKRCQDLLAILTRLPERWHGVFCGEGPQRQELEELCHKLNLIHRVHFIGAQPDVAPVYAALDAYAFLTCYESFGLVLAEAMAAGVPIFGLDGQGEYKEEKYPLITIGTAELVPRENPGDWKSPESPEVLDVLAQRIAEYGEHPEKYDSQIERARNWVHARFDVSIQAEAMTQIYSRILYPKRRAVTNAIDDPETCFPVDSKEFTT